MMDTRFAIADCRVSRRVAQYTLYRRGGGGDARGGRPLGGNLANPGREGDPGPRCNRGVQGPLAAQILLNRVHVEG